MFECQRGTLHIIILISNTGTPILYSIFTTYYVFNVQVFGSLLSWGILYGGLSTENNNGTSTFDVTVCGKNDCQDPNTTAENIDQYEPANDVTLYTTIGAMGFLCFLSIIITVLFIPEMKKSQESERKEVPVATVSSVELEKEEMERSDDTEGDNHQQILKKQVSILYVFLSYNP